MGHHWWHVRHIAGQREVKMPTSGAGDVETWDA